MPITDFTVDRWKLGAHGNKSLEHKLMHAFGGTAWVDNRDSSDIISVKYAYVAPGDTIADVLDRAFGKGFVKDKTVMGNHYRIGV